MTSQLYRNQVQLLLNVLPEVAQERCFALHGGTAINLFIRNMPRLSVDIDLTYLPLEDRPASIRNINDALLRLKRKLEAVIPNAAVEHKKEVAKLQVSVPGASIKVEVNLTKRGTYQNPVELALCQKAQEEFDVFCVVPVVPFGQLYGGKICAALDRQHPRDLFDVKYLLENEGFTDEVKVGFLWCLLGASRPISEMLYPNFLDQRNAFQNQFEGMANESFSYEDFTQVRNQLIQVIIESMTEKDKAFLLAFKAAQPDWSKYNFSEFASVKWKLQNLRMLKEENPEKHRELYLALAKKLGKITDVEKNE